MVRILALLVLIPVTAGLAWIGLTPRELRADFVVAIDEPRTLDPQRVSWSTEIQLAAALFEGLTRLNPESLRPEAGVAAEWRVSADRLTYEFDLRRDARWSNGDPVVAEDFRTAWLRALDPRAEAQYASLLFVVDGGEAYYASRLNLDAGDDQPAETVGIESLSADRLRVRLAHPCAYFLDLTSFPTFYPAHRETLAKWAYREGQVLRSTRHLWTRPQHMVCNGPFTLADWRFKERILLRANPNYWDSSLRGVESIEAAIVSNPNAALVAYQSGRVDLVTTLPTPIARELRRRAAAGERTDFHSGDRFATFFLRVNCRRWPLTNPDLRRALSLAIDREEFCEHVLGLGETPAMNYVPRRVLEHMPRTAADGRTIFYEPPMGLGEGLPRARRLAMARAALQRSGYLLHAAKRPLELAYAPNPDLRRIAEALQAMWEGNLGIRVELRVQEAKVLSARIRDLDYDLVRSDWYGDFLDPASFLDMFTTGNGQNRTGWSNPEYDALIAAAAREADNAQRFALLRDAERILCTKELPIIPLFFRRGVYLLNPRFEGLPDNVRDLLPIHRVRVRTTGAQ